MRYVALLRGINVGGNTMIKMQDLVTVFGSLGFESVRTYINSGNVAFDTRKTGEKQLAAKIEASIEKFFEKRIEVMVRERSEIADILANNPFNGEFESHKEMHVLFLKEKMPADKAAQLLAAALPGERFAIGERVIYCHLPMGVANSLLGKNFIEKKLKLSVTARNWRTVQKLADL